MIDATIVRVHQHVPFVIKKADQPEQAIGKSRGGRTTKIHVVVDALGLPIDLGITEGNCHDITQAEDLLRGKSSENVIANKGYDSHAFRDLILDSGRRVPGFWCLTKRGEQRQLGKVSELERKVRRRKTGVHSSRQMRNISA